MNNIANSINNNPTHFRGLELQQFQRDAIGELNRGYDVIVAAPTGAGKTLIADWAIAEVLKAGKEAIYASPVKALSNQKYRDYAGADHLGYDNVGLITGDVVINSYAPIQLMTTEIFHNRVLENPESLRYCDLVVFDELHYLDDDYRGTIWEESIMFTPPHMRMIALSASLPNIDDVLSWMKLQDRRVHVTRWPETKRPVPLEHRFWIPAALQKQHKDDTDSVPSSTDETADEFVAVAAGDVPDKWLASPFRPRRLRPGYIRSNFSEIKSAHRALIDSLEEHDQLPTIYFCTARQDCEDFALLHMDRVLIDEERMAVNLQRFDELVERYRVKRHSTTKLLRALVANGIAFHHAGMIPSLKIVVEELFTSRKLLLLFATETFAVGVNMPAQSVCFHYLAKYDGQEFRTLLGREYSQMAGRAGRMGKVKDKVGFVYSILHRHEARRSDLIRFETANVEAISSHFDPSYRSLLRIVFGLKVPFNEVWERSFAYHESIASKDGPLPLRSLNAKWRFLQRLRYIAPVDEETFSLLPKGEICQGIHGSEIHVTEAYDRGLITECSPIQLCTLFACIACQKKVSIKGKAPAVLDPVLQKKYIHWIEALRETEAAEGVVDQLGIPSFAIAPLVRKWAEGESLYEVMGMVNPKTGFRGGDFVGCLRMAIQAMKSLYMTLPREDSCLPTLKEAVARLWRDEVDATQHVMLED